MTTDNEIPNRKCKRCEKPVFVTGSSTIKMSGFKRFCTDNCRRLWCKEMKRDRKPERFAFRDDDRFQLPAFGATVKSKGDF